MLSKVYQKGQIVIPAMLRHKYGLGIGDVVEIIPEKGYLKLRKAKTKGLMDLAGAIESEKPFPSRKVIKAVVEDAFTKRSRGNK